MERPTWGEGAMVNSSDFDGMPSAQAKPAIADFVEGRGWGERAVSYRLRDWLISRQRYWGTPIPIIYCDSCGAIPVPEASLPVLLPPDAEFKPTGESPLASHKGFVNTSCPYCGGTARRETDTMDTFVDSSWYMERFTSPKYDRGPFDTQVMGQWMPVEQYTGGAEHAVMHLLYSRFFTKALRDLGMVEFDEPFLRLFNQGIILGEDHEKMSKSRGKRGQPRRICELPRCGFGAMLPHVPGPVGARRPLEHHGDKWGCPLAEPRLGSVFCMIAQSWRTGLQMRRPCGICCGGSTRR